MEAEGDSAEFYAALEEPPDNLEEPDEVVIDVQLKHCYAPEASVAEFLCRVTNADYVMWYFNGVPIHESDRYWITLNEWARLEVNSVRASDHGLYTVVCKNTTSIAISSAILFVIPKTHNVRGGLYLPLGRSKLEVIKELPNITVSIDEEFSLRAEIAITPRFQAEFIWLKNNIEITISTHAEAINEKCIIPEYHRYNASLEDNGIYTLIAKSADCYVTSVCYVLVLNQSSIPNKPRMGFLEPLPEITETKKWEETKLICKIENNHKFRWFKEDIMLEEDESIRFKYYGRGAIGLTLKCPQVDDSGTYTCIIQEQKTKKLFKSSGFLNVNDPPMTESLPKATVEVPLSRTLACIGTSLALYCRFRVPPTKYLYVVWHIGVLKVERSNHQFKVVCDGRNYVLYIKKLELDMLGQISCQLRFVLPNQSTVCIAITRGSLHHLPAVFFNEELKSQSEEIIVEKRHHKMFNMMTQVKWHFSKMNLLQYKDNALPSLEEVNEESPTQTSDKNENATGHTRQIDYEGNEKVKTGHGRQNDSSPGYLPRCSPSSSSQKEHHELTSDTESMITRYFDANSVFPVKLMDIVYCILDVNENTHFLMLENVNRGEKEIQAQVCQQYMDNQDILVYVQWKHEYPTDLWYLIQMALPNGEYADIGITSKPLFDIVSPAPEKILYFCIRMINPFDAIGTMALSVMPSKYAARPPPPPENIRIKNMELFNNEYKDAEDVKVYLGRGSFGSVCLIKDSDCNLYAAKIIKTRTQRRRDHALREFNILRGLNHKCLATLFDAFCSRDQFIMVMDYLWGGELFERIVDEENFKEATAVIYVRQLCEGLQYLHQRNIAHMDLKPENVMCLSPNSRDIKIVDFGLSREMKGDIVRVMYGTRDYISPEVLSFEPLTTYCDMWSLGVVTYVMLSGILPFTGESWPALSANITKGYYNYDDPSLEGLSSRAKNFIDMLLRKNPASRLSASEALLHIWLVKGPHSDIELGQSRHWRANLRYYLANKARWQRAGNLVIAANRLRPRMCASSASTRSPAAESKSTPSRPAI